MKISFEIVFETPNGREPETLVVDIKNPRATVANLRAAVAVTSKFPVTSFRLELNGTPLDQDSSLLSDIGIREGVALRLIRFAEAPRPLTAAPRRETQGTAEANPRLRADLAAMLRDAIANEQLSSSSDEDLDSDAFEAGLDADEFDDEEESTVESEDEEAMEQSEMIASLIALPNFDTLRTRFNLDPRAAMEDIQNMNADLFALIGRQPQLFLDFLRAGGVASSTQEPSATDPPALTPEDQGNIETLMQLGFSREQCVSAYLRCSKNVDRAAGALFER
jgi:hypothetical protein